MRSNKRFANTTFTRRVDHEAGRHHAKRSGREPAECGSCGAIYFKRRWNVKGSDSMHLRSTRVTTCPACLQSQGGVPSGYVYVEGDFFVAHREDIEHLLRNESKRAAEENPLARVMRWKENGKLTISTTTEHLAQRLGHALKKAFDGDLKYDFSHENKLARVTWRRD